MNENDLFNDEINELLNQLTCILNLFLSKSNNIKFNNYGALLPILPKQLNQILRT